MIKNIPTILIIVGISGDLAQRKLLPAIGEIYAAGALPDEFKILGISRQPNLQVKDLLTKTKNFSFVEEHTELFQMDLIGLNGYHALSAKLEEIEKKFSVPAQRLFYLAVPPQVSRPIIEQLGNSGLAKHGETKLLLEKPFGVDLKSATELVGYIEKYFNPDQVYRIDHYLARDTAQNLIVFRKSNSLFKRTWNNQFIESIEIIASEEIGIEGRATFYEQTGALRDLVQSHLLQLAALTLMEIPELDMLDEVPQYRLNALKQIDLPVGVSISECVKRGQYKGYRDEVKNSNSTVETFVSLTLNSKDPKWAGVPITLTTGKALKTKTTEIKISYKQDQGNESNKLILHLQPDEGVELCMWAKQPGYERRLSRHPLKFSFKEHYDTLPEAYEQVLFNAINSDHSLFTSSEEVLESWRIVNKIQQEWEMLGDEGLIFYEPGNLNI